MAPGQAAADLTAAVRAARDGSEAAFRELYREVQPGLLRYLRGLVGTQDAEDVAAESWLQIARDIRTFRDEGAGFRGWAASIARHRAMDHLRYVQRRPTASQSAEVLVDLPSRDDTAAAAVTAVATDAAVAFIATLPRDQAEAVLLRVVLGLDTAAAARVMGKRPGAVRTATWRGLRTLSTRLEQAGTPDAAATGTVWAGDLTPRTAG
ncbi:RNA polymerase sigma factor [Actinophytocola sp. NPDC049390]|uniref:RNA polymerase sigma factor n=1 Tax=Actinophytocola sp. NPDC049390 TaxID=3363894 RepID=UPI00379459EB